LANRKRRHKFQHARKERVWCAAAERVKHKPGRLTDEQDEGERHAQSHETVFEELTGPVLRSNAAGTKYAEMRKKSPIKNVALTEKKLLKMAPLSGSDTGQTPRRSGPRLASVVRHDQNDQRHLQSICCPVSEVRCSMQRQHRRGRRLRTVGRPKAELVVSPDDRATLTRWTARRTTAQPRRFGHASFSAARPECRT
jgi:hypothetical protein